jgi:uncharacterized protein YaaW (UPF0174 family)
MQELKNLLAAVGEGKRKPLVKLIDDSVYCTSSNPDEIIKGIRSISRSLAQDFYRDVFSKPESYKDILHDLCNHLKIKYKQFHSSEDLERMVCQKIMETVWEKMTPQQRKELDSELQKLAAKYGKTNEWVKAGGLGGVIISAELGGMTTYLLATSGLSALSSAIGVTLPFVAYTSLTSAMSVILGPIGWTAAALFAVYALTGPNYKKLILVVLYISALRNEKSNTRFSIFK